MTLEIDLPPELESDLIAAAGQQGVSTNEYALSVLKTALGVKSPPTGAKLLADGHNHGVAETGPDVADSQGYASYTREAVGHQAKVQQEHFYSRASLDEWQQAFQAWIQSHDDVLVPALSAESLRRENMYDDRGV